MGRTGQAGSQALSPTFAMLLRWFIVVPSMLLICFFCVWTACGLVVFTVFSQRCTAQGCTDAVASRLTEAVVLTGALNVELPQQLNTEVHKKVQAFVTVSSRKMRELEEAPENLVVDLEHAELERGQAQEQDANSFLHELKALGYKRRSSREEVLHAQPVPHQRSPQAARLKTPPLAYSVKPRNFRKTEHPSAKGLIISNYNGSLLKQGIVRSSNGNKTSDLPQSSSNDDSAVATIRFNMESSLEEEEKQYIGEGLQKIMQRLRHYSSTNNSLLERKAASCDGRWIYSYRDLPSKFNLDLVKLCDSFLPWYSHCEYFENSGLGRVVTSHKAEGILKPQGRWHQTNQYMLEIIFHARLKEYECLTDDPSQATLFHIPYYGGIDVFRYHYANVSFEKKDELGRELVEWLKGFESWRKHGGRDHFLVLGKITWDFRRTDTDWGNTLLLFPELQNVSKLLIERDPWQENDIGVPHPTFFHPHSDSDLDVWLSHVESSKRDSLVSFAGMPRTTDNIRTVLIDSCLAHPALCRFLECSGDVCFRPEATMQLFLRSHFCLQPVGDSATRRSVFDSLVAGCIPVLLSKDTAYVQYPWHLPRHISSYSVYVPSEDVKAGKVDVVKLLAGIPKQTRLLMRQNIVNNVIPKLVYFAPGSRKNNETSRYEDAFDVSIRSLLKKARAVHAG